ncbi:MAG: hypothetical protein ACR2HB_12670 [Dehalococcoidia bacterium]
MEDVGRMDRVERHFWLNRCLLTGAVVALLLGFCVPSTALRAQTSGALVTYSAGWNLVALPPGSEAAATPESLYHWLTNADAYQTISVNEETRTAVGYWAYFAAETRVTLAPGGAGAYQFQARPGHYVMIGNPSGASPALVTGADACYSYNPRMGYQQGTTLTPGEGAWAISLNGGPITITPQGESLPVPVPVSSHIVTSPKGYSLTVPTDWLQVSPLATQVHADLRLRSIDGDAQVGVFALTAADGASLDPLVELNAFIAALVEQPQSTQVAVVSEPAKTTVTNATTAAGGTVRYEFDGVAREDRFVAAVRGETVFVLDVVLSGPYLAQPDQASAQLVTSIVDSFQFMP